jgi:hypothetical protein
MKCYLDYTNYVIEITEPSLCGNVVFCWLLSVTDEDLGIGNVFYSRASNNYFVTPL